MPYYVTSHGTDTDGRRAPAAIDVGTSKQPLSLEDALAHACKLLSQNVPNVAISDGNGTSISGDELAACCSEQKTLTTDLQAVVN